MTSPTHHDPRGWTLHRTDYRETLAIVAEAGGADLIAFSPPYCDARTYGMDVSWGDADYAALGDAVWSALKPGGHALVNVDAPVRDWTRDGRGTERGMHPWRLMLDWHDRIGFRVPDRLAFGRFGAPGAYHGRFRNDWEPLLWFQKPGAEGYFDRWPLAEDAKSGAYVGHIARLTAQDGKAERLASGRAAEEGLKHRGSLWDYGFMGASQTGAPDIETQDHPARWPYKLARDLVLCFSAPGALVVDPFVGAGTTAAAAVDHGRRFIGGDLGARAADGVPWVTVAHGVLVERNRQERLFG
jgi:hypothetical protein